MSTVMTWGGGAWVVCISVGVYLLLLGTELKGCWCFAPYQG